MPDHVEAACGFEQSFDRAFNEVRAKGLIDGQERGVEKDADCPRSGGRNACRSTGVNISTGGSLKTPIEDRIAPSLRFSPEMCSLNMGSMNFSFHPLAGRYEEWKFDWEKAYVEDSESYIFRNTFRDIRKVAETLAPHEVKFEHECYDVGHLYNLKLCMDAGLFEPPVFVQLICGILGGTGPDMDNLVFMKRTADRLFRTGYRWSVLGAGAAQMPLAATASRMGGNVRMGLEDTSTSRAAGHEDPAHRGGFGLGDRDA